MSPPHHPDQQPRTISACAVLRGRLPVLLPGTVAAYCLIEPEHLRSIDLALTSGQPIMLQPAPETSTETGGLACLAEVITRHHLATGRCLVVLRGLSRVAVDSTEVTQHVLGATTPESRLPDSREEQQREELLRLLQQGCRAFLPYDLYQPLLSGERSLGTLCDLLSSGLAFDEETQQHLLQTEDVQTRYAFVLSKLGSLRACSLDRPLRFSDN